MRPSFWTHAPETAELVSTAARLVLQAPAPPDVGPDELVDYGPSLLRGAWFLAGFAVVALLSWYAVAPAVARLVRRRNRNNPTIQEAITRYVRAAGLVVAFYVGVGTAGYGQVLANSALIISAATLAIGVAGQEVIGSIISGLALVVDPEFGVDSYIEWEDGEGTVQSITLRVTRVRTPTGELVTIPNTTLTGQAIVRPFARGEYRVVDRIGLAYEDDVDEAIAELEAVAIDLEAIRSEPAPRAYVDELGDDAVVVCVHYWIEDPTRQEIFRIRSDYARAVKARLDDAGITVSPPSEHDLQGRIAIDGEDR